MVCTANDLSEWKDFPKGLRILLLDQDSDSAAEIKSKLESMDYIVSTFCSEDEALSAVSSIPESFHIAIVEVNTSNENGNFKFLETAKDLPTIMTSNINCLSTVMKCIALGAAEFLVKPLSEDKLRNIWQHVIHKAFNAGAESLKPVKESVISMLHLDLENVKPLDENLVNTEDEMASHRNDKYPAPSTPQLKQCGRSLDDGDCRDLMNCSEKESAELDVESKSVETTLGHPVAEATNLVSHTQTIDEIMVKEEDELADGSKSESSIHSDPKNKSNHNDAPEKPKAASSVHTSCASKANRKKLKIDWTPELHKKFVKAVEQLGIDQAIPSRILELMKVDGLTRHNVASHLQKYRMHKRHILPKEDDRRWPRRDHAPRSTCYPQKHIMPFPPYHSQLYPMWGAHHHLASAPVWGSPGYSPWQPSWHWKPYPEMQADAWGCPVMPPPPQGFGSSFPQNNTNHYYNNSILQSSFDIHPEDEVIDMVVKEAINKPWLPLPLGLKPPSTESVLAELSRQGISPVPSHTRCSSSSY